ncbi:hypothetical protein Prudu_017830 [Prunus dulcis]|uniref:Uncharacterized protein n=1 Tax=Prunus dulcis TaxID=3755 RepID=A0A4Y1RPG2_PRUDU|nr:hypothetical protein Prudu_017830 [Prunus dulcis]
MGTSPRSPFDDAKARLDVSTQVLEVVLSPLIRKSMERKTDPGTGFIQVFEGVFSNLVKLSGGLFSKFVISETDFLSLKHCYPHQQVLLASISLWWEASDSESESLDLLKRKMEFLALDSLPLCKMLCLVVVKEV